MIMMMMIDDYDDFGGDDVDDWVSTEVNYVAL